MERTVEYSREALRTLRRIDARTSKTIRSKIEQYAADPASLAANVKMLSGALKGKKRLRVGDWRVIFTESMTVLAIIKVAPRGGAYA